jgi:DNA polymerase-1
MANDLSSSAIAQANGESCDPRPSILLIDGHSLAFRSYYAFALSKQGPLRTASGIPTSVCFGFINSLLQVLASQKPQYVAIAFDRREPTFRHEADANYKADRKETPEDFIPDLENLNAILEALNLPIYTYAGFEADDVIGTLATQADAAGMQVKILSGDRDLFQLVKTNAISVLYLSRNSWGSAASSGYSEFDPAAVQAKLGVTPEQIVDYKALCGDKSDSIPGVRGIGEKTAVKLLQEYGSLAGVYANLDRITGATQKKLAEGKADAEHSQHLAQIILDVPIVPDWQDCQLTGFEIDRLIPLLKTLELNKFVTQIDHLQRQLGGTVPEKVRENLEIAPEKPNNLSDLPLFSSPSSPEPLKATHQAIAVAPAKPSPISPQIIDTPAKLADLIAILTQQTDRDRPVAWDTETTALDPREAKLVGIGCCWGNNPSDVAYIPVGHVEGEQLSLEFVLEGLRSLLESPLYPKTLQNAKFDRLIFLHQGIKLQGVVLDTLLASYVLHPELNHSLQDLCDRYLTTGITSLSYKELGIAKGKTIADLEITAIADYCGLDAYATYLLVEPLQAELADIPELKDLLLNVEQPLEPILAQMETTGIRINTDYLHQFSKQLEIDLARLEEKAYQEAGGAFNLSSPKQLAEILFETLGLDRKKSRKTKTGYSTDHATLEKLQGDHPLIDTILEQRTLSKLKSTYVDALPALIHPASQRIHTDFNQAVTATGRLSSSNPNLQNIPIRTEFSRRIRKAFLPQEGWLLVAADYSQIELRILAHLSQEPVLLEAYNQNQDVHAVTARLIFEKEEITSQERNLGKTINFGVIYGMGAQRFAREAGVSSSIGKQFIEKYRRRYSQVFDYLERMKRNAIATGYVTTIKGRRRYFNFVSDQLQKLRGSEPQLIDLKDLNITFGDSQLLRAAANAPIQGSSADIIKIAMVQLNEVLKDYQARLLLQVHDELVLEVPPEEWVSLQPKIITAMESAVTLSVPLKVDIHSGQNWMEAK